MKKMAEITLKNAAKINLSLDITGKLPDGYHTIESVFQTVGIYDEISVSLTDNRDIVLICSVPEIFAESDNIPCDERNIAYKSAKAFFSAAGISSGCRIHIRKGIPSQAGMGGGSSDAAAVLYALNLLTGNTISNEKLAEIGKSIGADVPFFLTGGTAYVCGIGEKITPVSSYADRILVIAKGKDGVSTAEAYRNTDNLVNPVHPDTTSLVSEINNGGENAYRYFGNLFESAINLESVLEIKEIMTGHNALSSVMTGSGSAVFGLFADEKSADICAENLVSRGFFAQVCRTVDKAFIEI
jgi:4-diphosphocytidyl-2-C-methyl-D-erythritol kinase